MIKTFQIIFFNLFKFIYDEYQLVNSINESNLFQYVIYLLFLQTIDQLANQLFRLKNSKAYLLSFNSIMNLKLLQQIDKQLVILQLFQKLIWILIKQVLVLTQIYVSFPLHAFLTYFNVYNLHHQIKNFEELTYVIFLNYLIKNYPTSSVSIFFFIKLIVYLMKKFIISYYFNDFYKIRSISYISIINHIEMLTNHAYFILYYLLVYIFTIIFKNASTYHQTFQCFFTITITQILIYFNQQVQSIIINFNLSQFNIIMPFTILAGMKLLSVFGAGTYAVDYLVDGIQKTAYNYWYPPAALSTQLQQKNPANWLNDVKFNQLGGNAIKLLNQMSNQKAMESITKFTQSSAGIAAITGLSIFASNYAIKQIAQQIADALTFDQNSVLILNQPLQNAQKWIQIKLGLYEALIKAGGAIQAYKPTSFGKQGKMFTLLSLDRQQQSLITIVTPSNTHFKRNLKSNTVVPIPYNTQKLKFQINEEIRPIIQKYTHIGRFYTIQNNEVFKKASDLVNKIFIALAKTKMTYPPDNPEWLKNQSQQLKSLYKQERLQLNTFLSVALQQLVNTLPIFRQQKSAFTLMQKYFNLFFNQKQLKRIAGQYNSWIRPEAQIQKQLQEIFYQLIKKRQKMASYQDRKINGEQIQIILNINYLNKFIMSLGQSPLKPQFSIVRQQILVPYIFKQLAQLQVDQKVSFTDQNPFISINDSLERQGFFSRTTKQLVSWFSRNQQSLRRISKASNLQLSAKLSQIMYKSAQSLFQSSQLSILIGTLWSWQVIGAFVFLNCGVWGFILSARIHYRQKHLQVRQASRDLQIKYGAYISSQNDVYTIMKHFIPALLQLTQLNTTLNQLNDNYSFQPQSSKHITQMLRDMQSFLLTYQKFLKQQLYAVDNVGQRKRINLLNPKPINNINDIIPSLNKNLFNKKSQIQKKYLRQIQPKQQGLIKRGAKQILRRINILPPQNQNLRQVTTGILNVAKKKKMIFQSQQQQSQQQIKPNPKRIFENTQSQWQKKQYPNPNPKKLQLQQQQSQQIQKTKSIPQHLMQKWGDSRQIKIIKNIYDSLINKPQPQIKRKQTFYKPKYKNKTQAIYTPQSQQKWEKPDYQPQKQKKLDYQRIAKIDDRPLTIQEYLILKRGP